MTALMKLLSRFSEVNRARKVKTVKEVIRGNTQTLPFEISISSKTHVQENMKFVTSHIQRESTKAADGGN